MFVVLLLYVYLFVGTELQRSFQFAIGPNFLVSKTKKYICFISLVVRICLIGTAAIIGLFLYVLYILGSHHVCGNCY